MSVDLTKGATVELVKTLSDDIRTQVDGTKGKSAGQVVRNLENSVKVLAKYHTDEMSFTDIQKVVKDGNAAKFFSIGDQIVTTWSDGTTSYECPFDVVAFRDVELENGNTVPAMLLQMHWCTKDSIQFDGNEAFYHGAMSAGTYHFTMGNSWGSNIVANKVYQFTLTQNVPSDGMVVLGTATSATGALPDTAPANWRVRSYASADATTPMEIVTLSEGSSGTDLGTLSSNTKYGDTGLNNMQRSAYGYNRWSQSAVRQYLNSSAAAGAWWSQKNPYDHAPDQINSVRGFMAGFPTEFLDVLNPIKVVTALNTTSDSQIGSSEITVDTFFLASLEEEYCVPQIAGIEGDYFPYWKERLGLDSPQASGTDNANPNHIRYAINAHTSAQHCRLRSALRGSASHAWYVNLTGYVSYTNAPTVSRLSPVCAIC